MANELRKAALGRRADELRRVTGEGLTNEDATHFMAGYDAAIQHLVALSALWEARTDRHQKVQDYLAREVADRTSGYDAIASKDAREDAGRWITQFGLDIGVGNERPVAEQLVERMKQRNV